MGKIKIKLHLAILFCGVALLFAGCENVNTREKIFVIATDIDYAPFEFKNAKGKDVGIDIEIFEEIAKDQKFKYKFKGLGFNSAITALESSQADGMMAGVIITDERRIKYDFSKGYYKTNVCVAVKKEENGIKTFEDLRGKKIALKTGTQAALFAESLKDKIGFTTNYFDETPIMYDEIKTGNSVACFEDQTVLEYGISQNNGLKIVLSSNSEFCYGFVVLKEKNQELLNMFNNGLDNIIQNGEYERIINKYVKRFGEVYEYN
ncbi:MAG: transporter substrate-binding domain-containing protein [Clostridiales bacterium]|nr:transporter substrate-binding domain-containing protein [Clostridiales bacterium]